jgi:hypothetical protein
VEVIAMKLIRNALAAGLAAAVSVAACSSQHGTTSGSGGPGQGGLAVNGGKTGGLGQLGLNLQIGNGVNLFTVNYSCTNGTNSFSGTINIGDAQSIEQVVGGIPDGTGYTCTLTGSDSAGDFCSGTTSSFSISAAQVSYATTVIQCTKATDAATAGNVETGSVLLDASAFVDGQAAFQCPGITSFAISPAEVLPPQTSALTGAATSFSGGTETITWSTSCAGASITNPNSLNATFNCGSATGVCNVNLTVGLIGTSPDGGSAGQVCTGVNFTSMTSTINCESGGACTCFAPTSTNCSGDGGCNCVNTSNAPVDPNNCGGCGVTCTAPATCQHNTGTNTNSCVTPPAQPCTQLVSGALKDNAGNGNCIKCDKNTNGVCSQTEAVIVQRDILKSLVNNGSPGTPQASTGAGLGSCYECLANAGCIDTQVGTVNTGLECDDLTSANLQGCLTTYNCIVGSPQGGTAGSGGTANGGGFTANSCTNDPSPGDGVFNCFCGSAETDTNDCKNGGTVAAGATGGLGVASPNGVCDVITINGIPGVTTSTANGTIITDLGATTNGSGMAYSIPQCAGSNELGPPCAQCYQ